ncbi:MAG TPA: helix-turn-helix domain-containing protein [Phycisphaerales bacterium]|nr:helix-turn-helix domain-containing protein [Phycisphaerales bacterium]
MDGTKQPARVDQKLATVTQAAAELNCSVRSIWRLIAARQLDAVKIGRAVRVTRTSIDRFIAQGGES